MEKLDNIPYIGNNYLLGMNRKVKLKQLLEKVDSDPSEEFSFLDAREASAAIGSFALSTDKMCKQNVTCTGNDRCTVNTSCSSNKVCGSNGACDHNGSCGKTLPFKV